MVYISGNEIEMLMDMRACIGIMRDVLKDLGEGKAHQVLRQVMRLEKGDILGLMPASIESKNVAGAKIITVFHENYKSGLPSHQGQVIVFETVNGVLKGIVEGETITAMRTAAVSAVATDLLARKDANTLALLGAGVQARKHLEAIMLVREIKHVKVWDINPEYTKRYAVEMGEKFGIDIRVCQTKEEAVSNSDIICTLTPSKEPILYGKHVSQGTHINAVGACTPDCREIDSQAMIMSRLFVDRKESTVNEAGDYIIPLEQGEISEGHIKGEIGDLLLDKVEGRLSAKDVTIFESLGLAVEDLAVANYLIDAHKVKGGV